MYIYIYIRDEAIILECIYIYDVYTVGHVWALYLSVDGRGTRKEENFCGLLDFDICFV